MSSLHDIERVLAGYLAEAMLVRAASEDALAHTLTSIQQFELVLFVESEFAVSLQHSMFADQTLTLADLARIIATSTPGQTA